MRSILIVLLVLVTAVPAGMSWAQKAPSESFEAYSYYTEARRHFLQERREEGIQALQKALELDPNYVDALEAMLGYGRGAGEAELGLQAGEKLLSLFPPCEENWERTELYYSRMLDIYSYQKRHEEGIAFRRRALTWDLSEEQLSSIRLGLVYQLFYYSGREGEAFKLCQEIINSSPPGSLQAIQAGFRKASMLTDWGDYHGAREAIARQMVGKPVSTAERWSLPTQGVILLIVKDVLGRNETSGLQEWLEAIMEKCGPGTAPTYWARRSLGTLLEAEGKYQEAIQTYEEMAEDISWGSAHWLIRAGDIYREHLKDIGWAAREYRRVLTDPDFNLPPFEKKPLEQARQRLEELGVWIPEEPLGRRPKSVWFINRYWYSLTHETLLKSGHYLVPPPEPGALLEQLASSEVVLGGWPSKGTIPWHRAQDLVNFVFRGGGLFLSSWGSNESSGEGSPFGLMGFGLRDLAGTAEGTMVAVSDSPIAEAAQGLKISHNTAIVCPPSAVLAETERGAVLAATEFGLGRVVICNFYVDYPYGGLTEGGSNSPDAGERFYQALFEWLRHGEDNRQLRASFRSASDALARRDYPEALERLKEICRSNPNTAWEEQARYLMAQVLQEKLRDYPAAQKEYETIFLKFPSGELALPALMGRAACLKASGAPWEKVMEQYRQIAAMAPKEEVGAAAQVHVAALLLQHKGAREALPKFRAAVENSPRGFAHAEALCGFAYCCEKTGDWEQAKEAYEEIHRLYWIHRAGLQEYGEAWAIYCLGVIPMRVNKNTGEAPIVTNWTKRRLERMKEIEMSDIIPASAPDGAR